MEAPRIPPGRFVWNCPGCSYRIDLMNLLPENLDILPDDTIQVLSGKSWKVDDKHVQGALSHMVSDHYEVQHLAGSGIHFISSGLGQWKIKTSQLSYRQRPRKIVGVKVEESEAALEELRGTTTMPQPG